MVKQIFYFPHTHNPLFICNRYFCDKNFFFFYLFFFYIKYYFWLFMFNFALNYIIRQLTKRKFSKYVIHMFFTGLIIAVCTFLIIGIFHPIVIKWEYYLGTRFWWLFLLLGIACIVIALFISNVLISALCGVTGASCLWSIGEIFEQKQRVKKGWFPMNPKRKNEYD